MKADIIMVDTLSKKTLDACAWIGEANSKAMLKSTQHDGWCDADTLSMSGRLTLGVKRQVVTSSLNMVASADSA